MTKASTPAKASLPAVFYRLTKPGIIYGNCLTAAAGFLLAHGRVDLAALAGMLAGLSLVVGSAGVINNYLDADIDSKMTRTKQRATVTRQISKRTVLIYGCLLLILGVLALSIFTNPKALLAALTGWFIYIFAYTPLKRHSVHATLVGSIAGAMPPVVGYLAAADKFNNASLLLFLILVFWQMPHFYSIAIYRSEEYRAAGVPVLPLIKGLKNTKQQILAYLLGFIIAACLLTLLGYSGYIYLAGIATTSLVWLRLYLKSYRLKDDNRWARQMFHFSLLTILVWSLLISLNHWLP